MPHEDSVLSIIYLLISNITFLVLLVCSIIIYMLSRGYKSVTIKLKKDKNTLSKEKINEQIYLSRLEKNVKKKKVDKH